MGTFTKMLQGLALSYVLAVDGAAAELPADTLLPAQLNLATAIALFRTHGYDLLLADASVQSALGGVQSAAQVFNPTLNVGMGQALGYQPTPNANGSVPSTLYYGASWSDNGVLLDFLLLHKRQRRRDVAEQSYQASRWGRVDVERQALAWLKQQWVAVIAAQKQLTLNQQLLTSNQATEALIVTRWQAGAASQLDVAMQKTATYEAAQQVDYARTAAAQAKAQLAFLLGHRGAPLSTFTVEDNLFQQAAPAPLGKTTKLQLWESARGQRADLVAQQYQVERARATLRLTARQNFPDLQLSLNYAQQGTGSNAISPPTLSLNLSLTPPLFYRLQGELTAAQADLRSQELSLAKLLAQLNNDIEMSWLAYEAAQARLQRMTHGYLEQSKLQYDLVRVQYQQGAASLVDVLLAERTLVTTQAEWVQDLNDMWTAIFALEAATAQQWTEASRP